MTNQEAYKLQAGMLKFALNGITVKDVGTGVGKLFRGLTRKPSVSDAFVNRGLTGDVQKILASTPAVSKAPAYSPPMLLSGRGSVIGNHAPTLIDEVPEGALQVRQDGLVLRPKHRGRVKTDVDVGDATTSRSNQDRYNASQLMSGASPKVAPSLGAVNTGNVYDETTRGIRSNLNKILTQVPDSTRAVNTGNVYDETTRGIRSNLNKILTQVPDSTTSLVPFKGKVAPKAPTTKAPATKAPATKAPATKAPATKAPATKAPNQFLTEAENNQLLNAGKAPATKAAPIATPTPTPKPTPSGKVSIDPNTTKNLSQTFDKVTAEEAARNAPVAAEKVPEPAAEAVREGYGDKLLKLIGGKVGPALPKNKFGQLFGQGQDERTIGQRVLTRGVAPVAAAGFAGNAAAVHNNNDEYAWQKQHPVLAYLNRTFRGKPEYKPKSYMLPSFTQD